jgi:hypothetical protein
VQLLTDFTVEAGDYTSRQWKDLFPNILATYRDGYIVTNRDKPQVQITASTLLPPSSLHPPLLTSLLSLALVFYPRWWLEAVGYFTHPPNRDPKAILFSPNPSEVTSATTSIATTLLACLMTATVFSAFGYQYAKFKFHRQGYATIGAEGAAGEINL